MKARNHKDIQECYRILNVEPGVEWTEIKRSFHRLARQHHPDCNAGNPESEDRFKALSTAYETLERLYQSRQFSYRVYAQPVPANDGPSSSVREVPPARAFAGVQPLSWIERLQNRLKDYEKKWLELNIEKEVILDPVTAACGGTIRIKNATGSFQVQVPHSVLNGTLLRIPGKGEAGLFHTVRGDLLLRIKVQPHRREAPGVAEYFYHVKVSPDSRHNTGIRTLQTSEGPIRYRLPRNVKDGQTFILKSGPHSSSGTVNHHIVVVDFL